MTQAKPVSKTAGIPILPSPPTLYPPDAFGDRFDIRKLPLARPATGYAVQYLGRDTLLDQHCGTFLSIRDPSLCALFESFDLAHQAASQWLQTQNTNDQNHPLAIVPAFHDARFERHVLNYGVLPLSP